MRLETRAAQPRAILARMTARYSGQDLLQELPAPEDHWDRATTAALSTPALIITGEHDLPARVRGPMRSAKRCPPRNAPAYLPPVTSRVSTTRTPTTTSCARS